MRGQSVELSKSASTSDLRDELADLMMRAVHMSYELTPTSPWIKVTEAIEVLISEALARHLREKHRGFDESFTCPHCRAVIR
jgi:hypothetical protein